MAVFESIDLALLSGELAANLPKVLDLDLDLDLETHHAWVIVQRRRLPLQKTLM